MSAVGWSHTHIPAGAQDKPGLPAERLYDVDRAKGFAIILVVFGHLAAREPAAGNDWYVVLKAVIYSFHMPFFMYLAGVVFAHGNARASQSAYWSYLRRRAERLLVPFVLFGLVILIGKLAARHVVHVDNVPDGFLDGLISLVWDTARSPATSVWFIFVLFVYCMITPVLLRVSRSWVWPLLVLGAVAHIAAITTTIPDHFYFDRILQHYLFFAIGLLVGGRLPQAMAVIDRTFPWTAALFAVVLALLAYQIGDAIGLTLSSLLSIPALHGLIRRAPLISSRVLLSIGGCSFAIYLLNTIFIGLAKGALLKLMPWDGLNFLLFAPVLMAAGLFGPMLTKQLVFRRIPVLDRMTS